MFRKIDINCDMGEEQGNDAEIIKYISSANIACGGHAGNEEIIKKTIEMALNNKVFPGAHPGYPDKENFGRIETDMKDKYVYDEIIKQIFQFEKISTSLGTKISHIKLHGALYNRAAADYNLMFSLASGIKKEFGNIPIFTLSGSVSEKAIADSGMKYYREGFADRAYTDRGELVSRLRPGAVLHNAEKIAGRVLKLVQTGIVNSISSNDIELKVDTVCVHGDTPGAIIMARSINDILKENQYKIGRNDAV